MDLATPSTSVIPCHCYELTGLVILDGAGQAIYAAPAEGSPLAHLVSDPLSISFAVSTDTVTTVRPQVLSTEELTPEDFGYVSFGPEVVEALGFLVAVFIYDEATQSLVLTSADITVTGDQEQLLYSGALLAATNQVRVPDSQARYRVTVTKQGYQVYAEDFTTAELASYFASANNGPLTIVLHSGSSPVASPALLALGEGHTCMRLGGGAVRCWGRSTYGQLGHGNTSSIGDDEPASAGGEVSLGAYAIQVAVGTHHSCALVDSGRVRCWGLNDMGQLGLGHTSSIGDNELALAGGEVALDRSAVQIAAGTDYTCALLDTGAVRCWGSNQQGQLGYGNTSTIGDDEPALAGGDVQIGGRAVHISAGAYHTCAVLDTGAIRCWGYNIHGELGLGHTRFIGDAEPAAAGGDVPLVP